MDFFEHQEHARSKTGWLIVLFVLALVGLIAGIYLIVRLILFAMYGMEGVTVSSYMRGEGSPLWTLLWHWDPDTFWLVVFGTGLIVLAGSMYKTVQLKDGGGAVADSLGGNLVDQSTRNPQERQLLNVVEEMALASGIPTPPVYILHHEPGINAFAAGYSPDDAAIGVTKGCVDLLWREELQGVIAHEFSHILNGDMRLNLKLIGLIHGLVLLGLTGRVLFRGMLYGGRSTYRMGRMSGGGALATMVFALGLMTIGSLGVFFGNMIKAAVSRQREFLADAAAVQFTRFPAGIAGALKKIGGLSEGSEMIDPNSEAYSHMFFSQGTSGSFATLFATHPPLIERIRRIEPRFHGQFPPVQRPEPTYAQEAAPGFAPQAVFTPQTVRPTKPIQPRTYGKKGSLLDPVVQIGQPTPEHLEYARSLIETLPGPVCDAARDPYGARALIYALLLNKDPESRKLQIDRLLNHADPAVYTETRKLEPAVGEVDPAARLPLIDMAIPTLTRLSPRQYTVFKTNMLKLIEADRRTELFEWMLQHLVLRYLEPRYRTVKKKTVQYYSLKRLTGHCSAVLSVLAYQPNCSDEQARTKFEAAAGHLQVPGLALLPRNRCGLSVMDDALDTLAQASPREKRKILQACAACVLSDNEVTVEEREVLRAVADSLGCPMPPLLAGQQVEALQEAAVAG